MIVPKFQGFPSFYAPEGIFRAWYFEPLVAILSFFVWIRLWWLAERENGLSRIQKVRPYLVSPTGGAHVLWSLASYCVGMYVWKMFIPPAAESIPDGIPTSIFQLAYLVIEVLAGIIGYDFVFFFIHCESLVCHSRACQGQS